MAVWIVVLYLPFSAFAQVTINEIVYDAPGSDEGREWIEIHNGSTAPIALSKWKFFESETNHAIKAVSVGTTSPGSFAIIASDPAQFLIDHPDFSGNLFDSSFSLSNKGETIALKNEKGETMDSVAYIAQGKPGKSLQKIRGVWVSSEPTPGVQNKEDAPQTDVSVAVIAKNSQAVSKSNVKPSTKTVSIKKEEKKTAPQSVEVMSAEKNTLVSNAVDAKKDDHLWIWILALVAVIVITLVGLYFIEGKKEAVVPSDEGFKATDFEIIEVKDED